MADKIHTRIAAQFLPMLAPMISTEETRYYLNGVYIEPHPSKPGVIAVATNGHIMGVAYDKDGQADKGRIFPLPRELLKAFDPNGIGEARFDGEFIHLFGADGNPDKRSFIGVSDEIDGTFPGWRKVVPLLSRKLDGPIGFNPRYLNAVTCAAEDNAAVLYAEDEKGPTLLRFPATPEFFAVLMPMKGWDEIKTPLPDWYE